jgi:hypothetical protein
MRLQLEGMILYHCIMRLTLSDVLPDQPRRAEDEDVLSLRHDVQDCG